MNALRPGTRRSRRVATRLTGPALTGPSGRAIEPVGVPGAAATRAEVTAGRAVLAAPEAGRAAPVGAFALREREVTGEEPRRAAPNLTAAVIVIDGTRSVRKSTAGSAEAAMDPGRALAAAMIAEGDGMLMGERNH